MLQVTSPQGGWQHTRDERHGLFEEKHTLRLHCGSGGSRKKIFFLEREIKQIESHEQYRANEGRPT
jgi:hypothetical protein